MQINDADAGKDPLYYPPEEDELLPEDEDYWIEHCGLGQDYEGCTKAGSEECDFECPYRDQVEEEEDDMQLAQREPYVIEWAKDKGLIQHTTEQALAQHGKTKEEVGELLEAIATFEERHDEAWKSMFEVDPDALMVAQQAMDLAKKEIALEAGDVLVTLIIQCAIQKQSLGYAMNSLKAGLMKVTYPTMDSRVAEIGKAIKAEATPWLFDMIGTLVGEIDMAIEPYDLALDECLEAAWHKIKGQH